MCGCSPPLSSCAPVLCGAGAPSAAGPEHSGWRPVAWGEPATAGGWLASGPGPVSVNAPGAAAAAAGAAAPAAAVEAAAAAAAAAVAAAAPASGAAPRAAGDSAPANPPHLDP